MLANLNHYSVYICCLLRQGYEIEAAVILRERRKIVCVVQRKHLESTLLRLFVRVFALLLVLLGQDFLVPF
jgi:hypothetical protein